MSAVMQSAPAMQITTVKEHIGALVTGIDLAQPVDAPTRKAGHDFDQTQHRRLYRMLVRGDRPY